jgi:microcystin-dependent protein
MKKPFLTLLLLLISSISFAQGISIQGIARDNESSAITDTSLTFTFSITKDDNTVLYAETQSIKTDNYGVFSHIVRTGNPLNSTSFNDIDFKIEDLKLIVSVDYNSNAIEVYNQTFQYTPYAHFAKKAGNGVPTGAIMPFLGETAPEGWVLCEGQNITSVAGSADLMSLLDGDNVPDLRGTFLRGTGTSLKNGQPGPELRKHQGDGFKEHLHAADLTGSTSSSGIHNHNYQDYYWSDQGDTDLYGTPSGDDVGRRNDVQRTTTSTGGHNHSVSVSGNTANANEGVTETRPVNYGVNYIIKL